ncbi:hypothetical protein [Salisediminibacterium halotolerans]|uniref:hypothetical protein n=1 Tax=Salisediminibacterium halotolerans TaxID=517425 RepID=UPI000EB5B947|nr:hypothetical protein [Salisediminibacterium halotolerans]RPE87804.1 hypothetical protein EDD67_1542 [Salisediminibacterium halotolerans]
MNKIKHSCAGAQNSQQWQQGTPAAISAFLNMTGLTRKAPPGNKRVLSVQYKERNRHDPADRQMYQYFSWLDRVMKGIIRVYNSENEAVFFLFNKVCLLRFKKDFGSETLCCWTICGGLLNKERNAVRPHGRFWIAASKAPSGRQGIYTALTDFQPALPWKLYVLTQGAVHPFVMNRFLTRK